MKFLEKLIIEDNVPVEIWASTTLSFTPVFSLVLKTYAEIVDKKLAAPSLELNNESRVVWAQLEDGTVLGGICYKFDDLWNAGNIVLSFTSPDHRGKGVNALCHPYVERDCKSSGYNRMSSTVHMKNTARIKSAEKIGMHPTFYIMYKRIPD